MPTYLFFKSTFYAAIKIFQHLTTQYDNPQEWQGLKAALRKYLNTHSLYAVDNMFMCKDDL